jgi:siderophore-iron reductase FhuF
VAAVKTTGECREATSVDPFNRFRDLIFDHFQPRIECWSARTDVTPRVFWSNVGNTFDAMLRRVEAVSGGADRLQQARRLLAEVRWSDGCSNPLFDAVYYVAESGMSVRRRRVRCLQCLLPDRRFCNACSIEDQSRTRVCSPLDGQLTRTSKCTEACVCKPGFSGLPCGRRPVFVSGKCRQLRFSFTWEARAFRRGFVDVL